MVCPCIRPADGAIEIDEWRARLVGASAATIRRSAIFRRLPRSYDDRFMNET
jgi:hypothetical protein